MLAVRQSKEGRYHQAINLQTCRLCSLRYLSTTKVLQKDKNNSDLRLDLNTNKEKTNEESLENKLESTKPPPDPLLVPKTELKDIAANIEQVAAAASTDSLQKNPEVTFKFRNPYNFLKITSST